ncbi:nicotinate (nicotinamide) nucleotide adenylyltransferase [Sandaracinus amylolyticus]|uniref:nicotinate (nicotinamide) nucleotide adenylyltransferase n=1 Tax=Sandaracinus amylolyticus TaxID=927083 RepID=UPI001F00B9D0|nr:nicotinate (nicotinamide) nucleotide adenylyltransferase [Sandaracinus amylolyticus]UJR79186.1 Nicotinate-nucleotide adenylyltransferase [Sandaracinus amylolyticus]
MSETIGVFGGSFDPPHCGHVLLATYALSAAPIDRLLVVPTFAHPFGKQMAPYEHRVAMCERAFGLLRGAEISRIEEELGGASYTVRTLEALHARRPGVTLRLLVGADVLGDLEKWKDFERVRALAPLFVVGRSGYAREEGMETPDLPAISSTRVREQLRAHRTIGGLVPRDVARYCDEHGLYRG